MPAFSKYSQICFDVPGAIVLCLGIIIVMLSLSRTYLPCFEPKRLTNPERTRSAKSFLVRMER